MKRWQSWLKLIWLAAAVVTLVIALAAFTPTPDSEVTGTLIFCMFILSFPAGWAAYAGVTLLADQFGPIYHSRVLLTEAWLLFVIAGYVQWFVVLPFLFRCFRQLRGSSAT
jgi:hypothetical protein